jgi:hypothetical protein
MMNRGEQKRALADEAWQWGDKKAWKPLRLARDRIRAPETMTMDVEPSEGHDGFLMSIGLPVVF